MRISQSGSLGVYVHIPFCRSKCFYCDFVSYAGLESFFPAYVEALSKEASLYEDSLVETLYVGGGTPTVLGENLLCALLDEMRSIFRLTSECEITLEANPGTITQTGLAILRGRGVNRLSLGVQGMDDKALALLGRIHTVSDVVNAVEYARHAGFENLNLDLIFGFPRQTLAQFQRSLTKALDLSPEHLSLYALSLEEHTPLAKQIQSGELPGPDSDLAAEMYEFAEDRLASEGYIHYEISNWARAPEFVSRHNIRYWQRKPYIGLGVAAHSFMNGRRFENVHSPELYIQAWSGEYCVAQQAKSPRHNPAAIAAELVDKEAAMAEVMFLGLRTAEGVLFKAFAAEFGEDLSAVYGSAITDLVGSGLLEEDSTGVRLTRRGRLLGNQVFYRFLPPVTENGQAKTAPHP